MGRVTQSITALGKHRSRWGICSKPGFSWSKGVGLPCPRLRRGGLGVVRQRAAQILEEEVL